MDKRKSILNVSVSIGFKLITLVAVILVKRFLIRYCGNDINGLNALYTSIIGTLSIAELGVGSAITFCMYKPIVEQDLNTVSALYHLFRRLYLIIGGVILACGVLLSPYITYFAKDYAELKVDFQLTFLLMLISVVVTYCFAAKTSLINAYKNNYITTAISSGGILLQYALQIVVLLLTGSFVWYLVCRIVAVLLQWLITELVAHRKHDSILQNRQALSAPVKKEVVKNIKAMFMHKIGAVFVNAMDGVVISAFVGVVSLGMYSNYTMILTSMTEIIKLVFTSLTSVVGHLFVEENKETSQKYCERFHLLNFVLGCVFFLGYYGIVENLVALLFAEEVIVTKTIAFVMTLNGFVQFMRQSVLMFRGATGTFYHDRWKPLFEGLTNLVLSLLLVQWIGVVGVLLSTLITSLLICHVIEPYVLYKHAFQASPKKFYIKNYGMIGIFAFMLLLLHYCMQALDNRWAELLVNGFISVGISLTVCALVFACNRDFREWLLANIKRKSQKKTQT